MNSATPNLPYDANGNLTSQTDANGITTYTWDGRNRLVAISGPGVSASFIYDALGRRVSKTINGVKTDYQYDGHDIIAELGGGVVGAIYLRSLNIDEPFVRQASSPEYYHTDVLGSTMRLTDANGTVATSYAYEAFGKTTIAGISTNPFQSTGRENDQGTGLYYYRARYYSPPLHRFIGEDPLRVALKPVNLYVYVRNNPLAYIDPYGLEPYEICSPGCMSVDIPADRDPQGVADAISGDLNYATRMSEETRQTLTALGNVGIIGISIINRVLRIPNDIQLRILDPKTYDIPNAEAALLPLNNDSNDSDSPGLDLGGRKP